MYLLCPNRLKFGNFICTYLIFTVLQFGNCDLLASNGSVSVITSHNNSNSAVTHSPELKYPPSIILNPVDGNNKVLDVLTSQNVELFKHADSKRESGRQIAAVDETREPKLLFSWWDSGDSSTAKVIQTTPTKEEHTAPSEDENEEAEAVTAESVTEMENRPTKKMYSWWTRMPLPEGEEEEPVPLPTTPGKVILDIRTPTPTPSKPAESEPTTSSQSETTGKPMTVTTKKPTRPTTKRPPRPTTKRSRVTHLPPDTGNDDDSDGPSGVKGKFVSIAKTVGQKVGQVVLDHAGPIAAKTAEKIAPVAKDAARQAGILALNAAGRFGNFTKNAAEQAYDNLRKKLNASEADLGIVKQPSTTTTTTRKPTIVNKQQDKISSNDHHFEDKDKNFYDDRDDESCGSVSVSSGMSTVFVACGLVLFRFCLN